MTADSVPVDNFTILRSIVAERTTLLLDFDGPICSVFARLPASTVADRLRSVLADGDYGHLPSNAQSSDPFDVLKYAASLGASEARSIESAMREYEIQAVSRAEPTAGTHDLMRKWHYIGRRIGIVSNNSVAAVHSYLNHHGLKDIVGAVSARTMLDVATLKPDPYLINQILKNLRTPPADCLLVGDSTTDILAAHAANTTIVGYANKPGKVGTLGSEHPDAIVTKMTLLRQVVDSL